MIRAATCATGNPAAPSRSGPARRAAVLILILLAIGAAIAGGAASALAQGGEPPRPPFIPDDFVFAFFDRRVSDSGMTLVLGEYVPRGESVTSWTQMITLHMIVHDRKKPIAPAAQAERLAKLWMAECPAGKAEVVVYQSKDKAGPAGLAAQCPKSRVTDKPEAVFMRFYLVSSGPDKLTLVNLQRSTAGDKPALSPKELRAWVEGVKNFAP